MTSTEEQHRQSLLSLRRKAAALVRDLDTALKGPRKNTPQQGKGCSVCGKPVRAKGFCQRHYLAKWHAGELGQHRTVERRW